MKRLYWIYLVAVWNMYSAAGTCLRYRTTCLDIHAYNETFFSQKNAISAANTSAFVQYDPVRNIVVLAIESDKDYDTTFRSLFEDFDLVFENSLPGGHVLKRDDFTYNTSLPKMLVDGSLSSIMPNFFNVTGIASALDTSAITGYFLNILGVSDMGNRTIFDQIYEVQQSHGTDENQDMNLTEWAQYDSRLVHYFTYTPDCVFLSGDIDDNIRSAIDGTCPIVQPMFHGTSYITDTVVFNTQYGHDTELSMCFPADSNPYCWDESGLNTLDLNKVNLSTSSWTTHVKPGINAYAVYNTTLNQVYICQRRMITGSQSISAQTSNLYMERGLCLPGEQDNDQRALACFGTLCLPYTPCLTCPINTYSEQIIVRNAINSLVRGSVTRIWRGYTSLMGIAFEASTRDTDTFIVYSGQTIVILYDQDLLYPEQPLLNVTLDSSTDLNFEVTFEGRKLIARVEISPLVQTPAVFRLLFHYEKEEVESSYFHVRKTRTVGYKRKCTPCRQGTFGTHPGMHTIDGCSEIPHTLAISQALTEILSNKDLLCPFMGPASSSMLLRTSEIYKGFISSDWAIESYFYTQNTPVQHIVREMNARLWSARDSTSTQFLLIPFHRIHKLHDDTGDDDTADIWLNKENILCIVTATGNATAQVTITATSGAQSHRALQKVYTAEGYIQQYWKLPPGNYTATRLGATGNVTRAVYVIEHAQMSSTHVHFGVLTIATVLAAPAPAVLAKQQTLDISLICSGAVLTREDKDEMQTVIALRCALPVDLVLFVGVSEYNAGARRLLSESIKVDFSIITGDPASLQTNLQTNTTWQNALPKISSVIYSIKPAPLQHDVQTRVQPREQTRSTSNILLSIFLVLVLIMVYIVVWYRQKLSTSGLATVDASKSAVGTRYQNKGDYYACYDEP